MRQAWRRHERDIPGGARKLPQRDKFPAAFIRPFQGSQISECHKQGVSQAHSFLQALRQLPKNQSFALLQLKGCAGPLFEYGQFGGLAFRLFQAARLQPALQQSLHAEKIDFPGTFLAVSFRVPQSAHGDADLVALHFSRFVAFKHPAYFEDPDLVVVMRHVMPHHLQQAGQQARPQAGGVITNGVGDLDDLSLLELAAQQAVLPREQRVVHHLVQSQRQQFASGCFHFVVAVLLAAAAQLCCAKRRRYGVQSPHLCHLFDQVHLLMQVKAPARRAQQQLLIVLAQHLQSPALQAVCNLCAVQLQSQQRIHFRHPAFDLLILPGPGIAIQYAFELFGAGQLAEQAGRPFTGQRASLRADPALEAIRAVGGNTQIARADPNIDRIKSGGLQQHAAGVSGDHAILRPHDPCQGHAAFGVGDQQVFRA